MPAALAFFGIVLVALGAEIPDTINSVTVAKRGYGSMSTSSCMGSQICNICVGLGEPAPVARELRLGGADLEAAGTWALDDSQRAKLGELHGDHNVSEANPHGGCPLAEIWITAMGSPALDAAVELGHELLVVPWLPEDLRTADGYRSVAERLNRFGEAARGVGLRFGYHNHAFEFLFLYFELMSS